MKPPPVWLLRSVIEAVHDEQIAEHGGAPGLRDAGLLESALARPMALPTYREPDMFDLATTMRSELCIIATAAPRKQRRKSKRFE